jgi:hypothetical protein
LAQTAIFCTSQRFVVGVRTLQCGASTRQKWGRKSARKRRRVAREQHNAYVRAPKTWKDSVQTSKNAENSWQWSLSSGINYA